MFINSKKPKQSSRAAWVTGTFTAGGIGPVCRYAAEGVAKAAGWRTTVVSLHDKADAWTDAASGVRYVALGLTANAPKEFLQWLAANPQDIVITSDVCHIEASFPFFPKESLHVIQIHDSLRRYRDVAVRNHLWVDGVVCVARHIEAPLRASLQKSGCRGLLDAVHNGASFPPIPTRGPHSGPLRLLFVGRMDPFKGIYDLVPILQRLEKMAVHVRLTIVGGRHELLGRRLKQKKLEHLVTWAGRVPHEDCYRLAAESDVFLMLSRKEPFGMVTIEAMSMGCVPIAYDVPSGSTEIIEQGKSGLLVPLGDLRAWAEQIRTLHYDRQRLADLSAGAIARARDHFSAEVMAKNLANFLAEVLVHAETCPSRRETGMPPEAPANYAPAVRGYQRFPAGLREWIRNRVCTYPRLSYWLLNR